MATKKTVSPKAVRQKLESLKRAGVTHLPHKKRQAAKAPAAAAARVAPAAAAPTAAATAHAAKSVAPARPASRPAPAAAASKPASRLVQLNVLRQEVAGCTLCQELAETRTQTVFGVGNPQARLCFFGEAPGADEDRTGEPFVGRAGQLLTKIIEACTLTREDVYILNVLKCRPPNNRPPHPAEVANCRRYFERQFEILKPEFICCLGTSAAQALLETDQTIGKLRAGFHQYRGATVLCTYHPSYLLRNPAAKRDVWEDMKRLMKEMGIHLA